MNSENILTEDGLIHSGSYPETYDAAIFQIVSREEFNELQREHDKDAEGVSFEEYCETEREAWNEMLKEQLKEPWEKSIPDYMMDSKRISANNRAAKKSLSTASIRNAIGIMHTG